MKYRPLSLVELEALKDEFIRFLIVQGIDAAEWQRINKIDEAKSQWIVDAFSDFVWEGIVSKVKFIDLFCGNSLKLFKCDTHEIHLINLECDHQYTNIETFLDALHQDNSQFYTQRATKAYYPDRGIEIFRMIENGGLISNGESFIHFSSSHHCL